MGVSNTQILNIEEEPHECPSAGYINNKLNNMKSLFKRKYTKIMNVEMNKVGFSKIWFLLKDPLLGKFEILDKFIPRLFKKFRKNKSYFLIAKIEYINGEIKSLHRGIIVTNIQNNNYLSFIKNCISEKDEYYIQEDLLKLIFEFFEIKEKTLSKILLNWNNLDRELPNKSFKIIDHTPNNPDYKTWGNIIHDREEYKIVLSIDSNYAFKVYPDYAEAYLNGTFHKKFDFSSIEGKFKFF